MSIRAQQFRARNKINLFGILWLEILYRTMILTTYNIFFYFRFLVTPVINKFKHFIQIDWLALWLDSVLLVIWHHVDLLMTKSAMFMMEVLAVAKQWTWYVTSVVLRMRAMCMCIFRDMVEPWHFVRSRCISSQVNEIGNYLLVLYTFKI